MDLQHILNVIESKIAPNTPEQQVRSPQNQQLSSAKFSLFGTPNAQADTSQIPYPAISPYPLKVPSWAEGTDGYTYSLGALDANTPGHSNPNGASQPVGGIDYHAGITKSTRNGNTLTGSTYPFLDKQNRPIYFDSLGNQYYMENGKYILDPNQYPRHTMVSPGPLSPGTGYDPEILKQMGTSGSPYYGADTNSFNPTYYNSVVKK